MDDEIAQDLRGVRSAHDELVGRLGALDDLDVRRPSRLPDWSVGHVLAHIARNGESVAHRLEGAARDEVVDQYAGGAEGRAAGIEAGARRPVAEQLADIEAVQVRIEAAAADLAGDAWDRSSRSVDGRLARARDLPLARWRELEVHHVDLGLGYEVADWPSEFVQRALPRALAGVGERLPGLDDIDPAMVLAWAFGRADPPPGLPVLRPY